MAFVREHKLALGIFALALAVRVLYFGAGLAAHHGNLIATSHAADLYYDISQNILAGHGFSGSDQAPYEPNSFRTPLQPYFLAGSAALFGGSYWAPLILTLLLGSLIPLLGMVIARRVFGEGTIERWTGIILALEPFSILFSSLFYSETLFIVFLLGSIIYLLDYFKTHRLKHLVFTAMLLGFATLTRPTSEYLPVLVAELLLWDGRYALMPALKRTLLYIALSLLVLSPWLYRNYTQFGVAELTPQAGVNLYSNFLPSVLSVENGTSFDEEQKKINEQGIPGANRTNLTEAQGYISAVIPLLLAHPVALLLMTGTVELTFFTHDGMLDVLKFLTIRPDAPLGTPALYLLVHDPFKLLAFVGHYLTTPFALIFVMRIFWIVVTILLFLGAWKYLREKSLLPGLTLLTIIAYTAFVSIILGLTINARYRLPVEALILPFALYGFLYCKELWHRFRS